MPPSRSAASAPADARNQPATFPLRRSAGREQQPTDRARRGSPSSAAGGWPSGRCPRRRPTGGSRLPARRGTTRPRRGESSPRSRPCRRIAACARLVLLAGMAGSFVSGTRRLGSRRGRRTGRPARMSSSCVPTSTTLAPSSTTIKSAMRTVEKRCETRIVTPPVGRRRRHARPRRSARTARARSRRRAPRSARRARAAAGRRA